MTQQQFISHLDSLPGNDKDSFIKQFGKDYDEIEQYINQHNPECHDVFDRIKRPDKLVKKPSGRKDPITQNDILTDFIQPVTRIAVDIQQEVTKCASGILCTNKIQLVGTVDVQPIQEVWDNNKLDLRTISICNYWLSETEVAELWYKSDNEDKVMVLANSLGDRLYPIFDDVGKMIAFIRKYSAKQIAAGMIDLKEVNYYEIYTETDVVKGNDSDGVFAFDNAVKHGYDKIPVIYASRDKPIWSSVQSSIDRWEESISNLCDTNDYFASPIAIVKGKIKSYADKGESGKMLELEPDADIHHLTWDQAPESIKLEWETLRSIVYNSTRTVNLSIDNLKGLFGSAPSSYAIKLLFTPAHMQAAENEEIFGEYIQRRINFIASFTGVESGAVQPKFTYYLPKNDAEKITTIIDLYVKKLISRETALTLLEGFVSDPESELIKIEAEENEKQKLQVQQAGKILPLQQGSNSKATTNK